MKSHGLFSLTKYRDESDAGSGSGDEPDAAAIAAQEAADAKAAEDATKAEEERLAKEAEDADPALLKEKLDAANAELEALRKADADAKAAKEAADLAAAKPEAGAPKPPEVMPFRDMAYQEAVRYFKGNPEFFTPEGALTQKGCDWYEDRALQLASEHTLKTSREADLVRNIEVSKPAAVVYYTKEFAENNAIPAEHSADVAKDFVEIMAGFGIAGIDESTPEKQQNCQKLRDHAFLSALGALKLRELKAAQDGKTEPGSGGTAAPVSSGGTGGGGIYDGLSKDDAAWLKNEWIPKRNGGKPPSKEQLAELKKGPLANVGA